VAPGRPRLLRLRPSRGLGEPALEALVGSTAYVPFFRELTSSRAKGSCCSRVFARHRCPWCLLYFKQAPGVLLAPISHRGLLSSGAKGSRRSRVLRGMGARGACSTSSRSRAAFSRRYPIEGCYRLEPRARAARGFRAHGCPRCLLYFKQAPGGLLAPISLRGLSLSRAGGPPRLRVLFAWQGTGSLNVSQSRLRFLQRGRAFLGAAAARARSWRRGRQT
jgi:hypothetical protein